MENTRNSYDDNLKWNVKDLYSHIEDFETDYKLTEEEIAEYEKFKGHLLDDAETLYNFLEMDSRISQRVDRIYIYSHIQSDQDTSDTKFQALYDRAVRLYEKLLSASSYAVPELLASDYNIVETFIKKDERLVPYERMLKEIFRKKKHILTSEQEQLLSDLASVFSVPDDVFSFLTDSDLKFGTILDETGKEVELSEKTYYKLITSPSRETRKRAFDRLFEVYGKFKNTYAKLLASEVDANNKLSTIRGFNSALEASLFENNIPRSIVDNLISVVKKNVSPLSRYWKLKREVLGIEELHLYDANAPTAASCDKTYTFDQARDIICDTLHILGEEYSSALSKAFSEHWIDAPANDGKRNGAYCTKCYGVHPYVLLSFDGTLNSVSTLAHELGHAMHDYFAINNRTYQDHNYSIFVAEVASQVNQILLSLKLIRESKNRDEKIYLLDDLIRDFKATIYRQTMFANFEVDIHDMSKRGETLTHEVLSDLYYKLNEEYFGENIVIDDIIKYEWERIPHFYMNFYVYQYATAYAAAIIIARKIDRGDEGAVEDYIEFLKLGSTKTPVDSLRVAGVDMEDEQTMADAFLYFDELVEQLEENMRC